MAKLVSKTYGEALLQIAMEQDKALFLSQVVFVKDALSIDPRLNTLMRHPGISRQEKTDVLDAIFEENICKELMGFLRLIVAKDRYRDLPDILEYFIKGMKEYTKVGTAYVATAKELSDLQKEAVQKRLVETTGYNTVEVEYQVDESLIAGMVIRINDRVVDSSVKTKLNDLTKQLMQIQLG